MEQEELFNLQDEMRTATEEERMNKLKEFFPNFRIKHTKIGVINSKYGLANKYRLTLQNGTEKYNTTFTDSIINHSQGKVSSDLNMLYCVVTDAQCYESTVSFHDFCNEFGYDEYEEEKKARKCYEGCQKALEGLERLVGYDGYEILNAITYGY